MEFDKQKLKFTTLIHKNIHIAALRITPLEVSLGDVYGIDENLVKSCKSYHGFILDMLFDMYSNPHEYGFKAGVFEEFSEGRPPNAMKQKKPNETEKHLKETRNCYQHYVLFLSEILTFGTIIAANEVLMSMKDYEHIIKQFDYTATKRKTRLNNISLKKRMNALKRVEIIFEFIDDIVVIKSEKYLNIFYALSELTASIITVKTFGKEGLYNCEFRQIFNNYTPCYDDVVQTLDSEKREIINVLNDHLAEFKIKAKCNTFWKVNYKYKGKQLCQIITEGNDCRFWITGSYNWDDKDRFNERIEEFDEEMQKYILRNLNYCTGCSSFHIGGFKYVLGKRKRLCAGIGFKIHNPKMSDVEKIKSLISLRQELIMKI